MAAVVLAAGRGRRIGGPKALLAVEGETFVARVVRRLRRPALGPVFAVVAADVPAAAQAGRDAGAAVVPNTDVEAGMLRSILLGLDAAQAAGADAVLVHPVDHPLVEEETVDAVLAAVTAGARIAVPSHGGRRGHPAGFARDAWPALRAASPQVGAVAVLRAHPDWIVHVPGGPGCVAGIDTPEDYARLVG